MNSIQSKLVKDGNSTAVRIPKALLEMSGITGVVEISAEKGRVIIKNVKKPRANWAQSIGSDTYAVDQELADWDSLTGDGLND